MGKGRRDSGQLARIRRVGTWNFAPRCVGRNSAAYCAILQVLSRSLIARRGGGIRCAIPPYAPARERRQYDSIVLRKRQSRGDNVEAQGNRLRLGAVLLHDWR